MIRQAALGRNSKYTDILHFEIRYNRLYLKDGHFVEDNPVEFLSWSQDKDYMEVSKDHLNFTLQ